MCGHGCYTLTVNDSYGDGLQYSGVVGNYTMVDGDGNVLAQMIDGGNFGSQAVDNFCVEAGNSVPGCIDSTACNYDAEATADDGSCEYGQTYFLDKRWRRVRECGERGVLQRRVAGQRVFPIRRLQRRQQHRVPRSARHCSGEF